MMYQLDLTVMLTVIGIAILASIYLRLKDPDLSYPARSMLKLTRPLKT